MDVRRVVELLKLLGASNVRPTEKWVSASCPLAVWTHAKRRDDAPSFGVSISPGAPSRWRCFGCAPSRGGALMDLVWALQKFSAEDYADAATFIRRHELTADPEALASVAALLSKRKEASGDRATWSGYVRPLPATSVELIPAGLPVLPDEDLLTRFQPIEGEAETYLRGRGLGPTEWAFWELRWHPGARRIAIPIRDWQGQLVGITGRSVVAGEKRRWMHSKGYRRDFVLFGAHKLAGRRSAVLVEGHFDVMGLWRQGYAAVGVQGSYLSAYQRKRCVELFDRVTILRDGDVPGLAAAQAWQRDLAGLVEVRQAPAIEGRDPDEYSQEELMDILGPPTARREADSFVF